MKIFNIFVLSFSALALFYACSMRLINPTGAVFLQNYFENPANSLELHIDLANEIRGVGAVMLLGGIVGLLGAIRPDFRQTAFVVLTVIFGGVVLGRSLSLIVDGMIHINLLRAFVAEGVLGALNVFCLVNGLIQSRKGTE